VLVKRRLALYLLLLAAAACGKKPNASGPVPQSMNESVAQFLVAVKANNQKRMGELWGTERGPAAASMNSDVLRQRLAVIQKYLDHTGYRIIEGPMLVAGRDDLRSYRVELQRANCSQVIPVDVVRTHSGGWLVYDVHLEAAGSPVGRCQPATPATPPAPPPPPGGTRP
jgi:ABC-type transporter MlaC component